MTEGLFRSDGPAALLATAQKAENARKIWLVPERASGPELAGMTAAQKAWAEANGFTGAARKHLVLADAEGRIAGVALGLGDGATGDPCGPAGLLAGLLPTLVPAGAYALAEGTPDAADAAVAWALGAYRYRRYKSGAEQPVAAATLVVANDAERARAVAVAEGVWLGRDLINTPANDMGPADLEAAARAVASRHGATVTSTVGDELLAANLPTIHAVGRASSRAPRLIDMRWGAGRGPRVTLIGKGICFDTGGLDLKPSAAMLLMKKDMGGAASALALGHMIMSLRLGVELRVLIAAAENSVSGNAFRPGDVIRTRSGRTVEIGNTDAEGRLVLCDALALADVEAPDLMVTFATLTGAARVALGPDLPALFTDDDQLAANILAAGNRVGDPVWRLPFWPGYERLLDSEIADMNNVSDGPFAGSVTAALFLRRFTRQAKRYAHLDMYGWRPSARPLGPKGGEPHAARALLEVVERMAGPQ